MGFWVMVLALHKKDSYLCSQNIKSVGKLKFWRPKPCPEIYGGWEANTPTKLL